jgi:hypothetical protein
MQFGNTIKGACSTQQVGHNGLKLVSNLRLRAEDPSLVSDRREALVEHGSQWQDGAGDGVMRKLGRVVTSPHAHLVTGALGGLDDLLGYVGCSSRACGLSEAYSSVCRARCHEEASFKEAEEYAG